MRRNKIVKLILSVMIGLTVFTMMFLGAYLFIQKKFGIPNEVLAKAQEIIEEFRNKPFTQKIKERETESILANLIIKTPKEEGDSGLFLLEIMDVLSGKLLLITLPSDTQITLSNELYVSLQSEMPTVPQILLLETIFKLAEEQKACGYAKRMLGDFLGIEIMAYTILPEAIFQEYLSVDFDEVVRLSERTEELMVQPVTVRGSRDLFLEIYETEGFFSELTYDKNSWYLEYYEGLKPSLVTAVMAEGEQKNEAFFLDVLKVRQAVYD